MIGLEDRFEERILVASKLISAGKRITENAKLKLDNINVSMHFLK
jgi:hypothetical protein